MSRTWKEGNLPNINPVPSLKFFTDNYNDNIVNSLFTQPSADFTGVETGIHVVSGINGASAFSFNDLTMNGGALAIVDCNIKITNTCALDTVVQSKGSAIYEGCSTSGVASFGTHYAFQNDSIAWLQDVTFLNPALTNTLVEARELSKVYITPSIGLDGSSAVADIELSGFAEITYGGFIIADGVTFEASGNSVLRDNSGIIAAGSSENVDGKVLVQHVVTAAEVTASKVTITGGVKFINTSSNVVIHRTSGAVDNTLGFMTITVNGAEIELDFDQGFPLVAGDIVVVDNGVIVL